MPAAAISFCIGTLLLLGIVFVSGEAGNLTKVADVRWYYLIGGVLGAAYVTKVLLNGANAGCWGRDGRDRCRPAHDVGRD
jgi:uncharacterized membrane protein YdcZ (DUF606 family)